MTIMEKMLVFLMKTGKSYTAESMSKILHLNYETARKYLRSAYNVGNVDRFKSDGMYRYHV